jgi:sugar/nucleoside kinase (ribokinase family)
MNKYDILFIGPGCIDENVDCTGETIHSPGGAVYFAVYSARAAGAAVMGAVKMNPSDRQVSDSFGRIPLQILPSKETTRMKNIYTDPTREKRISTVAAQADPILPEDVPEGEFGLCHLAGLLYGDFPNGLIDSLHGRCRLSADMQGFLRCNEGGKLFFHDWDVKKKYLPYFTYLKADANEAKITTGMDDRREAARQLRKWGAKEILISHNEEMLVYDGQDFCTVPVRAKNLSGRTGRGDTVFASYLARREKGDSIPDALLYATALVSLKMATPGPFGGQDADVRKFIRDFYSDV